MDRFIVPKIRDSIEERKRKYDEIILKAEQFNQKAKKSLAKYEDKIAAAKINMSEQIQKHEEELRKIIKENPCTAQFLDESATHGFFRYFYFFACFSMAFLQQLWHIAT